jgi:hypothetical protein
MRLRDYRQSSGQISRAACSFSLTLFENSYRHAWSGDDMSLPAGGPPKAWCPPVWAFNCQPRWDIPSRRWRLALRVLDSNANAIPKEMGNV